MGIDYSNGWDVVVATSFDKVNALLAYAYQQNVLPRSGSGQFPVPVGTVTVNANVNGSVGAWTMTGGTGQNVILDVPFTGGTSVIGGQTFQLSGVILEVTVLLRFVKSTLGGGSSEYQLMLNMTDPSAIVAVGLKNPPPNLTSDDRTALTIALRSLLQTSLAGAGLAIAKLDLSEIPASYPWLIPRQGIDYAASSTGAGTGALGVLLATVHPPPGVPPTLVAGTLPAGCNGALIISNSIFTQQLLAPALASSLGVSTNQLVYGGANPMTISLQGSASVKGASINFAQATANDNAVSLTMRGSASPMSGVDVNFTINATYALVLGGTRSNPTLSFERTSQNESHSTDIAWWVYLVSGLTGGAIGLAVVAIIQAVVNNSAGATLGGTLPSGFASGFAWPFGGAVAITQAQLPTPLQLGGNVTAG
jgi:hypothetical protein